MLFIYPNDNWLCTGIECEQKRMIHEASMVYTKKHHRATGGFVGKGEFGNQGEGVKMVDGMSDKTVAKSEISKVMICICHSNNTINKDRFKKSQVCDIKLPPKEKQLIKFTFNI